jgi:hypothetical protein
VTNPTLDILETVDSIIATARDQHPDIPEKIVVVMDSGARKGGMVHGHFARLSWHDDYNEIKLGTESLSRGAVPTLGTILHELSHAIAFTRGVKDTSNKGRYHNGKFREIALEVGIHVEQAGTIGWSQTTVPDSTKDVYADLIERLDKAITTYRVGYIETKGTTATKTKKASTKMACGCGDPVTVNKGWFDRVGQFAVCQNCSQNFELMDTDD